jgi:Mat/Ecp fimbriae major subunit
MLKANKNMIIRAGFVAAAIAAAAGMATSVQAATTNAGASAIILAPVQLTKTADLNFAVVLPGTSADTVAVSATGVRTCGAALVCSGTVAAAAFDIAGSGGYAYAITLPASITLSSGANSMTVNSFTSSKTGNAGTLAAGGTDNFSVGATLNVGAGQAAGTYNGTFAVTVDYN